MKRHIPFFLFALLPFLAIGQSNSCSNPAPICANYPDVHYPLTYETPVTAMTNNYNCLDPWGPIGKAWHYVEVGQSGNIHLSLQSTNNIGAILWGPFPSVAAASGQCGNLQNVVSCDDTNYPFAYLGINDANAGDIYLMLVMSHGYPATFTFTQTNVFSPGAGTTDCSDVGSFMLGCADDVFMETCNDSIPAPISTAADFYHEGGSFVGACNGFIGLSSKILYDDQGTGCPGDSRTVVRTYYAADVCGNIGTCNQTIHFPESENDPIALCPPSVAIGCSNELTPDIHTQYIEVVTDCNLGYTVEIVDSSYIGGNWGQDCDFAEYVYDVRVRDVCGRTGYCQLRYTVLGDAPVFMDDIHPHPDTCELPPLIKECNDPMIDHEQLVADWIASMDVRGSCGEPVTVTTNYDEDNFEYTCGLAGEQIVTFMAEDACGRLSFCTGKVVNVDTKPPAISSRADDLTVTCDDDVQAAFDAWLADYGGFFGFDCCTPVTWSYEPAEPQLPSPCAGENSVSVTFIMSDECGFSTTSEATFTVEGTPDLSLTAEASDLEVSCSDDVDGLLQNWLATNGGASASACGAVTWSYAPENPSITNVCDENIEVTFTANDACGNAVATMATFRVSDTEAPTFTFVPTNADDTATAEDACDTMVEVTFEDMDATDPCALVRVWTATDDCGNTAQATTNLGSNDTEAPVFNNIPNDTTLDCNDEIPALPTISATDDTDTDVAITFSETTLAGNCAGNYTLQRQWTATDDCENTNVATQTITVEDTTPPVLQNVPTDLTFFCSDDIDFPIPTATDDCSDINITFEDTYNDGAIPGNDCNGGFGYDIFRTWTVSDACGNATTAETVAWVVPDDYSGPSFSFVPQGRMIDCSAAPDFGTATCTSFCGNVVLTYEDSMTAGDCGEATAYVRTWTGIDACGNTTTASQVLTIQDTEAPVFTFVPEDKTMLCGETPVFGTPMCEDNCSDIDHLDVAYEDATIEGGCAYQRTWTVTDACGNVAQAIQKIHFDDQEAPVFSSIVAEKSISCGQMFDFDTPTAGDNCSENIAITFEDIVLENECAFGEIRQRTWIATDACGNVQEMTQTIRMEDTEAPIFSFVPESQQITCGSTFDFEEPTVEDACTEVTLTFEDNHLFDDCQNGDTFRRVWTATDACGNVAQAEQVFTSLPDQTPPTFSKTPQNSVVSCADEMVFDNLFATDICSGVELVFEDEIITENCDYSYSMKRTWTATDACGNTNQISQILTMEDTETPVFEYIPESKVLLCGQVVEFGEPEVTDGCSTVSLIYEDSEVYDPCAGNIYTRTWTATDACGNKSLATQQFTTEADTNAPTFSSTPTDKTVECGAEIIFANIAATDVCSGVELVIEDQTTTTCTHTYSTTRTWIATDACGNVNITQQTITVEDQTAPVLLNTLDNKTIACGTPLTFDEPEAADNCSEVTILYEDAETTVGCTTTYVRTWTVSDACGNAIEVQQNIEQTDDEAPVFETPAVDIEMSLADLETWTPVPPIVSDACSTVTLNEVEITEFIDCMAPITYTYRWVATDVCDNASEWTQTVRITDVMYPTVAVQTPEDMDCGESYTLTTTVEGGIGTFQYDWQIASEGNWTIEGQGQNATLIADEGTAVLTLTLQNEYGCYMTTTTEVACLETTNTHTPTVARDLILTPNPTTGQLSLSLEATQPSDAVIQVYNSLGQVVFAENWQTQLGLNTKMVSLEHLPANTYWLRVLNHEGQQIVRSFVKTE